MNSDRSLSVGMGIASLGIASPTKEKILLTAIDMFSVNGYSGVSVRDITKAVGIKESSLYNHFRNKEEILDSIFTLLRTEYQKLTPSSEVLDSILPNTTLEKFMQLGYQLYIKLVNDETLGKTWRILQMEQYRNAHARDILLNTIMGGTLAFMETVFAKMITLKYIKPLDPALLASEYQYPVFAMGSEYNMLKFQDQDTSSIERKLENHVQFFVQLIRAD